MGGKRIEIDGKYYRMRNGKLVQIPDEWVGKVTTHKTKRKRKEHAQQKREIRKNRIKKLRDEQEKDDLVVAESIDFTMTLNLSESDENDELP